MSLLSRRSKSTNKAARRRRPSLRPDFELLEDRRLLAPLNPLDFLSLGAFPTAPGMYTIDTRGTTPTLSGPGGTFSGVVSGGVAVFDFDSITIGNGQTLVNTAFTVPAASPLPVALLSRGDATINGTVNVSASYNISPALGIGGPGGGSSDTGPGAGGRSSPGLGGGGGGGFGGPGGAGAPDAVSGGVGGTPYGELLQQLQGGSGGGGSVYQDGGSLDDGGGGGGAIEIDAVDTLTIAGTVSANGSPGSSSGAAGGGSGGILLHANSVILSGSLSAIGAIGSPFVRGIYVGGGGGGGRVSIVTGAGGFSGSLASINVSGGAGGGPGAAAGGLGQVAIIGPFVVMNTNDSGIGSLVSVGKLPSLPNRKPNVGDFVDR